MVYIRAEDRASATGLPREVLLILPSRDVYKPYQEIYNRFGPFLLRSCLQRVGTIYTAD